MYTEKRLYLKIILCHIYLCNIFYKMTKFDRRSICLDIARGLALGHSYSISYVARDMCRCARSRELPVRHACESRARSMESSSSRCLHVAGHIPPARLWIYYRRLQKRRPYQWARRLWFLAGIGRMSRAVLFCVKREFFSVQTDARGQRIWDTGRATVAYVVVHVTTPTVVVTCISITN
jgi:hypothetical protein